ncbi:MAG: hypothetical protein ABIH85_00170 [Candidatus Omnitrophota bacterium]
MKKSIEKFSSYENGKVFKKTNGNKSIGGIDSRIKTLKRIDRIRAILPPLSKTEIKKLIDQAN